MEKVYQVMEQMKSLNFNDSFNEMNEDQFESLIRSMFLPWHTFDFEKKCTLFSKHTCHEVNFFLFKKDKVFFEKVVQLLIKNKLEKQFIDHYLLASSSTGNDNYFYPNFEHSKHILDNISEEPIVEALNLFEKCLLIEFTLSNGSDTEKK